MPTEEASTEVNPPEDRLLDTGHLRGDLKGRAIRGGAVTMAGQGVKFFLRMVAYVILRRLLPPEEFDPIIMVTVVTEFALMFKDMGLATATIQRKKVTNDQVSTLFWINVAITVVLAALIAASSPLIAWGYNQPELKPDLMKITPILATGVILAGLAIQHQALLKRQMRFGAVAVVELISIAVGFAVGITAALLNAGYWALVFMNLSTSAAMAAGVWIATGWRPGLPRLHCGVGSMINFGRDVMGYRLVHYFARYVDKMMIGRFCVLGTLALYQSAYGLLMLPITQITYPITSVAVPALSRIQDEPRRFANYYERMVQLLAFVTMPLVVLLAVCAESVIALFGDNWAGAAVIFQILAVTAFIQPLSSTIGIVLLSIGQTGRLFKLGIITSFAIVSGFVIGIKWGANGVAAGYAVASYVVLLPGLWYGFRTTPVRVWTAVRAILRPAIASGATAVALILVHPHLQDMAHVAIFSICFVIAVFVYFLMWILMPGGISVLRDFAGYIAIVYKKKGSQGDNERMTS